MIKAYFGDELLFFAHHYIAKRHIRPLTFLELFEFMRYENVDGMMKAAELEARRGKDNG